MDWIQFILKMFKLRVKDHRFTAKTLNAGLAK